MTAFERPRRPRRGAGILGIAAASLVFLAVCATAREVSILGPRDVLQISVYLQPDLTQEVRIDDQGRIALPLIGSVPAAGFTVESLTKLLTARYREYLNDPQLSVIVKEYYKREVEVSVLGEVARPGRYSFAEGSTILEALSHVGGLTKESGNRVVILRQPAPGAAGTVESVIVDTDELFSPKGMSGQNVVLREGDTVNVPRADMYFVSGAVARPGYFKLEKGAAITVTRAISQAGGFTERASRNRIQLIRGENADKTEVEVTLDTPIQASDTLVVPENVEIEVAVLGEVARPGRYKFPEHFTIIEALSQVGGLSTESGDRVLVLRPGSEGRQEPEAIVVPTEKLYSPGGAPGLDIELHNGDTVNVPRADQFFIFGEVARPGAYKLPKGTTFTVLKAIILAGGFTDKAAKKGLKITREEGAEKKNIKADLDTFVRSQDIIIVPESFF